MGRKERLVELAASQSKGILTPDGEFVKYDMTFMTVGDLKLQAIDTIEKFCQMCVIRVTVPTPHRVTVLCYRADEQWGALTRFATTSHEFAINETPAVNIILRERHSVKYKYLDRDIHVNGIRPMSTHTWDKCCTIYCSANKIETVLPGGHSVVALVDFVI